MRSHTGSGGRLDKTRIRTTAEDFLGLSLTADEADSLVEPLEGLRHLVELIERVPLPFNALPFITPLAADRWLEEWPEPESAASQSESGTRLGDGA